MNMNKIFHLTLLFAFCLNFGNAFAQNIRCKLEGKVIGRDSKYLILLKATEDPRFAGIKIPIEKNVFSFELEVPFVEKYKLIFGDEYEDGGYKPIAFFTENCSVNFVLHSLEDFDKNTITGSVLTQKMKDFEQQVRSKFYVQYKPFQAILDSLEESNNYWSENAKQLQAQLRNKPNENERYKLLAALEELSVSEEMWTPMALIQMHKKDSISKIRLDWQYEYIQRNPDVFSYSLLWKLFDDISSGDKNINFAVLIEMYQKFSKLYPTHPYTNTIAEMLNAIQTIKVGNHFLDFSAPTIEGEVITISEQIKGKVALIDMWASWCGPCRGLSKSIIPIYEKYKDKGFTIVGIAREFKTTNQFKTAVKNDKYPWLNLIELDDKNGIWNKYNINKGGGNTYLVDSNGVILAIHPKAEELEKILEGMLK
jgi:thiol-disulfide isomerase/thioredoxin